MNAKNRLYHVTLLFLATLLSSLYAKTYTNKTFFSLRPHNLYLPLEQTLWYHSKAYHSKKTGGSVQLTSIAQFSSDGHDQGTYFMFGKTNTLNIGRNTDIDNRNLKFNETSTSAINGTIKLEPKIQHYGLRVDYHQDLNHLIKNFSLKIGIPFVFATAKPYSTVIGTGSSENAKTINDYFHGKSMWSITGQEGENIDLQKPLEFGKISDPVEKFGMANINFVFERTIINNTSTLLTFNAHVLIPTDTSPKAHFLFEPTIGTADHWGTGLSVNGAFKLSDNFDFIYDARWTFLIHKTERRILGLKNRTGTLLDWGQYMLLGKVGLPYVEPAANMLAQLVRVYPRNHFETLMMASYHNNGICFEAGYDLFFRQRERLTKKTAFIEDTYAFVGSEFANDLVSSLPSVANFSLDDANVNNTIGLIKPKGGSSGVREAITASQIDVTPAQHPKVLTHTVFVSGGYTWNDNEVALNIGTGFSIEIPNDNAGLWQNSVWLKSSLLF